MSDVNIIEFSEYRSHDRSKSRDRCCVKVAMPTRSWPAVKSAMRTIVDGNPSPKIRLAMKCTVAGGHLGDYREEDGGQAIIITLSDDNDTQDDGQFIRLQSWSAEKNHPDWIKNAEGKKFKIIIEEVG